MNSAGLVSILRRQKSRIIGKGDADNNIEDNIRKNRWVEEKRKIREEGEIKDEKEIDENVNSHNIGLIITSYRNRGMQRETLPLAKKLYSEGIDVLLTQIPWPRDSIFIDKTGMMQVVWHSPKLPEISYDVRTTEHEAYHGGKFLIATEKENFLIASESMLEEKREATQKIMDIKEAAYFDIRSVSDIFKVYTVSGNKKFYFSNEYYYHIDKYMNIGNKKKVIVTYKHPVLIRYAEEASRMTGYDRVFLPLHDARYAAVCFQEIEDMIIIDRRAKDSADILKEAGYKIMKTPKSMKRTNTLGGGIHCLFKEVPDIKKIAFADEKEHPKNRNTYLMSLDGRYVLVPKQTKKSVYSSNASLY